MVLRPFSCSKAEIKLLTDAVGEMPQLKYDFQGATTIFFHLHNFNRFSADQIEELDTAIIVKDANMEQILRSYFPNATADCVYNVFTQWAGLGFHSWIFFRSKIHWSHQIFLKYCPFKIVVDDLLPALNEIVLGSKT